MPRPNQPEFAVKKSEFDEIRRVIHPTITYGTTEAGPFKYLIFPGETARRRAVIDVQTAGFRVFYQRSWGGMVKV